jgi:hypothetical protein
LGLSASSIASSMPKRSKQRPLLAVEAHAVEQQRLHVVEELDDAGVGLLAFHPEHRELGAQGVAHDPQRDVEVVVQHGAAAGAVRRARRCAPTCR